MGKAVNGRNHRITVRFSDEEWNQMNNMTKKYTIDKSEIVRMGIRSLETGNSMILPQLCQLCTICNEIIEKGNISSEDKIRMEGELKKIWEKF